MEKKRISFGQGKGSLTHNNRVFIADNVDRERIKDNITFKAQPIQEAYQHLFGEAVERHNAQQKRNARKFDDYYKHVFKRDYSNNVIQSNNGERLNHSLKPVDFMTSIRDTVRIQKIEIMV